MIYDIGCQHTHTHIHIYVYTYMYKCISLSLSLYLSLYTYIYIYRERERMRPYIYMYVYVYLVRLGNHQDVFVKVSIADIIQLVWIVSVVGLFMVAVVAGNVVLWFPSLGFFYGFRCGRKLLCLWFPCLQQQTAEAEAQGLHKVYTRSTRGLHEFYTRAAVARTDFVWFPSLVFVFIVSAVARNDFVWFPSLVCLLWFPAATGPRLSLRWKL